MWGAYFCMGTYKLDVVVVIKMGTYFYGVLILCGCLFCVGAYPDFTVGGLWKAVEWAVLTV